MGELALQVPKVREGDFYPASLEKGLRSERALKLALAEMYVQGVSTRKVAAITEQLCGLAVTVSEVSRAAQALDGQLTAWRERPLEAYAYVYLDARYEKVRHGGLVVDVAVLLAAGVRPDGQREVLGCWVRSIGARSPLARFPGVAEGPWPARHPALYPRCPRRAESGQAGDFPRYSLATVSISSAKERRRLHPTPVAAPGGGRRATHHL